MSRACCSPRNTGSTKGTFCCQIRQTVRLWCCKTSYLVSPAAMMCMCKRCELDTSADPLFRVALERSIPSPTCYRTLQVGVKGGRTFCSVIDPSPRRVRGEVAKARAYTGDGSGLLRPPGAGSRVSRLAALPRVTAGRGTHEGQRCAVLAAAQSDGYAARIGVDTVNVQA